jgi:hypothetical protein
MVCPNKTNGARRIVNKLSAPASKKFSRNHAGRGKKNFSEVEKTVIAKFWALA